MNSKRLIIAGMGSIGLRHARLYSSLPGLQVEVCDSREAGLGEARTLLPDAPQWSDYAAAVASRPDYVLIATPHQAHSEMACLALENGCRVLCEKPMSHHLDEASLMTSCARETGSPLAVGFHLRFHPSVVRLRAMLQSGEAGRLLSIRYRVDSLVTLENSRSRYQSHLPGALLMDYSHGLDLLHHLLGEPPVRMSAQGMAGEIAGYSANPLVFGALFSYPSLQAELHLSYTGKPEVHCLELTTSKYNIRLELNSGAFVRHHIADGTSEDLSFAFERDALYLAQWQAFQDFCEGKPSPICSAEQALESNRIMALLIEFLEHDAPPAPSPAFPAIQLAYS